MEIVGRCGPDWLHDRVAAGGRLVIDGAMGSELEARGVPMNQRAWSGAAAMTHPEVVRQTHADYIEAGAELIIANTFSSARHALERAGLGDEVARINRTAVELAQQARDEVAVGPVAIAGSMCDLGDDKGRVVDKSDSFREQAELLAEAGVDLITLEMSSHPERTPRITEAALATGLPVWLGTCCRQEAETGRLVCHAERSADFGALLDHVGGLGVSVINIMHTSVEDTTAGIPVLKEHWAGPFGVYPESGHFVMPNWQFVDIIEPDDLVQEARGWVASGAQIIGGCCGLGVPHIRALKAAFG